MKLHIFTCTFLHVISHTCEVNSINCKRRHQTSVETTGFQWFFEVLTSDEAVQASKSIFLI